MTETGETKSCYSCEQVYPIEAYGVKLRHPDGSIRSRQGRCPICRAELSIASQRRCRERRQSGYAVDAEPTVWLDPAPFQAWLRGRMSLGVDVTAFAARLDVDQRQVSRWLLEVTRVRLDTVDRALCQLGDPGVLATLYPHLYEGPGFDDDEQVEELAA